MSPSIKQKREVLKIKRRVLHDKSTGAAVPARTCPASHCSSPQRHAGARMGKRQRSSLTHQLYRAVILTGADFTINLAMHASGSFAHTSQMQLWVGEAVVHGIQRTRHSTPFDNRIDARMVDTSSLSPLKPVGSVLKCATGIKLCPGCQTLLIWRHMAFTVSEPPKKENERALQASLSKAIRQMVSRHCAC